ncbi:family 31 glycosyltransferase [Phaffia rhodozyma]|uniref:Hexosyltransferase n=1 Tax=Phaffia rhodozyma TaxID=264483 RepID=A0A0F7SNJ7_PHARH|nr:family 31 glycosyltransferase [Phaffia rhodozyma]
MDAADQPRSSPELTSPSVVATPNDSLPPIPLTSYISSLSSRVRSYRHRVLSVILPRSKVRTVLSLIIIFVTIALTTIIVHGLSPKNFTLQLPPLDLYSVGQTPKDEISRSFEEPDFSLLSSRQPSSIGCPQKNSSTAPLLVLGIFTAPDDHTSNHIKRLNRRNIIRDKIIPDWPSKVEIKFIFGTPRTEEIRSIISAEQEQYGDIVVVDGVEAINSGKTHAFFKWAATQRQGENPKFVMKTDEDTFFAMPNVIASFESLDCSENIYWGTSAGISYYYQFYLRGLGYAMSWPLVSWIGSANIATAHIIKDEDARTGQWLRMLDPSVDPLHVVDYGWMMGDFNQLDIGVETVALHWLKWDEWLEEQIINVKQIWSNAGRLWDPSAGIDPKLSLELGKSKPGAAQAESERQKAEGWDT